MKNYQSELDINSSNWKRFAKWLNNLFRRERKRKIKDCWDKDQNSRRKNDG